MPQDGSSNYQYPPGTPGIPDQTIESEAYNTFLDDLVTNDLNIPRPIHRGGTGANNANNALVNLTAEKATQLVTDYDSQVWLPGSFYSATSATAAPVAGHAFAGICYIDQPLVFPPTNANVTVEARDQSDTTVPGRVYVRQKKAGVWDTSWAVQAGSIADMDTAYVNVSGDTMTGLLTASGNPTADMHVATKQYVDGGVAGIPGKVSKAGDTMTGLLTLSGDPTAIMHAATKQYVDGGVGGVGGGLTAKVDKAGGAGGIMTGLLTLSADPTAVLHASTKQYVDAAAAVAMADSGMQINGGMEVSQERGTTPVATSNVYICDGWQQVFSGTMAVAGAAQPAPYVSGITNILYMTCSTAQASLGAGDFCAIWQRIEGYRISRLGFGKANALPITLCFWSMHHRTGLYSGTIRNGANNRTYVFTYTQAAADAPQYNIINIPGDSNVSATWPVDNSVGMVVTFSNGSGTTFTAPSINTWLAGNYQAAPGQVNGVAATSDVFRITGVTILPGTQAPTAVQSPLLMRPYDQELVTCQRYYEITNLIVSTTGTPTGFWKTAKRIAPTLVPTFDAGSGAGFANLGNGLYSFFQNAAHSQTATLTMRGDARLP